MKKLLALLALLPVLAFGQTAFTKYGPAAGIQKNTGSTPYDTAAVAADIYGLWSGTCSSTTFLRGDGACAAPTGTITGVSITPAGGMSVTGSPCSSGSCSFTFSTTLTGPVKGNGSAFTTALAADIYGLWSGTCNSTTFLRGDGSCATAGVTVPGSNGQVIYNSSGALSANSGFTYDGSGSITLAGRVQALGTNNQFGATSAQSFGTSIGASTDGSHYAVHTSVDANGNQVCFGLNVSGSTQCNIPTGNFGIGYTTVLPFGIYRNGVSQLSFTTGGAATFVGSATVNGTMNATTAVQVNGVNVCQSTGTNCPAAGSPGGTNGQIQYNNSGSFGGAGFLIGASGGLYSTAQADNGANSINVSNLYQSTNWPVARFVAWSGTCSSSGCITGKSIGISSVTRTGTGLYTVTLSNAMSNGVCTASIFGVSTAVGIYVNSNANSTTTVEVVNGSGTAVDQGFMIQCVN